MKCKHCGKEIKDSAFICPYCGVMQSREYEDGRIGFLGLLCFILPPLGIVLFSRWKHKMPERANGAMSSSLYGIVLIVVFVLFIAGTIG